MKILRILSFTCAILITALMGQSLNTRLDVSRQPFSYVANQTNFGLDCFRLIPSEKGAVFQWELHSHETPTSIVIHIPFFVTLQTVVVDGKTFRMVPFDSTENNAFPHVTPQEVILPATSHQVRLNWQYNVRLYEFSYRFFVRKFYWNLAGNLTKTVRIENCYIKAAGEVKCVKT